jgi:hypothetical protein
MYLCDAPLRPEIAPMPQISRAAPGPGLCRVPAIARVGLWASEALSLVRGSNELGYDLIRAPDKF